MTAKRKRTTWSGDGNPREAAKSHKADIYTMNQEHPQPGPTDYESGSPDTWAETPTGNENVEAEYEGGRVKRNEVGLGEFRDDTFGKDREFGDRKYENKTAAVRKATAAERVARHLLRTTDESAIKNQALDLMALPGRHLASTLKRLDSTSPDVLPKELKYKRALACCKVAAMVTGYDEGRHPDGSQRSKLNERFARVLTTLDDPTLKEIVKLSAMSRAALDVDEDEDEDNKTSMSDKDKDKDDVVLSPPVSMDGHGVVDNPMAAKPSVAMPPTAPDGAEACMGEEDMAMLDGLLQQELGGPPGAAPSMPPAPTGELTDLFEGVPGHAEMAIPAMASQGSEIEISFGDDGEGRTASDDDVAALDGIFADNAEVQAQRELVASAQEQSAREGGYFPGNRTASAGGARKLGQVQGSRTPDVDGSLENLWERPPGA